MAKPRARTEEEARIRMEVRLRASSLKLYRNAARFDGRSLASWIRLACDTYLEAEVPGRTNTRAKRRRVYSGR